ncbi:MAG: hypothetical protein HYS18_07635 [Burkholderiales bacterium]|nr:hypothetical protein [Burkholderiales bacterium]
MTTKDTQDMSDAEFDALLQGRGELADLLRAVPQPAPSAELDAAILARAEAALRAPDADVPKAANDPRMPGTSHAKRPNFVLRWKVPLALAATVILGVHMIGWDALLFPAHKGEEILSDAAPQATAGASQPRAEEAPAATAPTPAPQTQAQLKEQAEKKDKASSEAAKAVPAQPVQRFKQEAVAQAPAIPSATASAPVSAEAPAAPPPPPPVAAAAPAGQIGAAASGQAARAETDALAKQKSADANANLMEAAPREARKAAAPAPAAAPMARAYNMQGAQDANTMPEPPQAWLARIEKLMKDERKKEALEEWAKFRKAYPDYQVRKEFSEQMEALKK